MLKYCPDEPLVIKKLLTTEHKMWIRILNSTCLTTLLFPSPGNVRKKKWKKAHYKKQTLSLV